MARLIAEGSGAVCKHVADATPDELTESSLVAFGSPALGDEGIDETEMAPFTASAATTLRDKKIALFGSYGWGSGEWLKRWGDDLSKSGLDVMGDRLAIHETPEGDAAAKCRDFGKKLAGIAKNNGK
jgi:flavorubredoxin